MSDLIGAGRRGRAGRRAVRTWRRRLALCLGVGATLTLLACGGNGDTDAGEGENTTPPDLVSGGTLRIGLADEAPTLDIGFSTAASAAYRSTTVMEGLYAFDADWNPQPMLAEDLTLSDDELTATVTIRDAKFHNGNPVTADDVKASIDRSIRLKLGLDKVLESVTVVDEKTVDLHLIRPTGSLLILLADRSSAIFPKTSIDAAGDQPIDFEGMIGTGPYKYVEWKRDDVLVLERFEDYVPREEPASGLAGRKVAYADRIEINSITDATARKSAMDAGQLDAVNSMPQDLLDTYNASTVYSPAYALTGFVVLNFNHADSPMANHELRKAILTGLDMDEIAAGQGPQEVWNLYPGLPAEGVGYASEEGTEGWDEGDKETAEQMVAASGYNGEPVTVTANRTTQATYNAGIVLVEELKKMGINAQFNLVDLATLNEVRGKDSGWDIIMGAETQAPSLLTARPAALCGNEFGQFCDERMDAAYQELLAATDEQTIQEAHNEIQRLTLELVPYIKLNEYKNVWLINNDAKGMDLSVYPHYWNTQAPDAV